MKNNKRDLLMLIICIVNIVVMILSLVCILVLGVSMFIGIPEEIKDNIIVAISIFNPLLAIVTIFLTLALHRGDSKQNNQILADIQKFIEINKAYYDLQGQALSGETASKLKLMNCTFSLNRIEIKKYLKNKVATFENICKGSGSCQRIIMELFFNVERANEIKELHIKKFRLNRHAKSRDGLLDIDGGESLNIKLATQVLDNRHFSVEVFTDVDFDNFGKLVEKLDVERNPTNQSPSRLDFEIVFDYSTYDKQSGEFTTKCRAYLDVKDKSDNIFIFKPETNEFV